MPEYRVETLYLHAFMSLAEINKVIEDKINEYIKDGYRLFSHQMAYILVGLEIQLVFIKED